MLPVVPLGQAGERSGRTGSSTPLMPSDDKACFAYCLPVLNSSMRSDVTVPADLHSSIVSAGAALLMGPATISTWSVNKVLHASKRICKSGDMLYRVNATAIAKPERAMLAANSMSCNRFEARANFRIKPVLRQRAVDGVTWIVRLERRPPRLPGV